MMVQTGEPRGVRMQKVLSQAGIASRRVAEKMILDGRVEVDGQLVTELGTRVDPEMAVIRVDGARVVLDDTLVYLALNKPRGLVTTAADEKGRDTVYSLLEGERLPWVAPVGRLDKASEGLLLVTNDSEWGARVAAPETHLENTYHVQIAAIADEGLLTPLRKGVRVDDGESRRTLRANLLRAGEKNCWLEIVLDEGKNRQIRRMLAALDVEVMRLIRVAIGPLQLGQLAKGSYRLLTERETRMIDRVMDERSARNKNPHVSQKTRDMGHPIREIC